jgi:hypothetical protein
MQALDNVSQFVTVGRHDPRCPRSRNPLDSRSRRRSATRRYNSLTMKRTLICALWFAFTIVPSTIPGQASKYPANAKSNMQADAKQDGTSAAPSVIANSVVANSITSESDNTSTRQPTSDNKSHPIGIAELPPKGWADWVTWVAGIVLVLIGAAGVCFAYRTLKAIEGQLKEIRDAGKQTDRIIEQAGKQVDATLLRAQSAINSERPWMFINFVMDIGQVGTDPPVRFRVSFVNEGRTPAEVISFEQHLDCRGNTDDLPAPPVYTTPEGQVLLHTAMVASGKEWKDRGESSFTLNDNFPSAQWQDIRGSRQRALYWGRLRYRDLIEQPRTIHDLGNEKVGGIHETCFCYFYSPALRDFLITGPYGYNKHT